MNYGGCECPDHWWGTDPPYCPVHNPGVSVTYTPYLPTFTFTRAPESWECVRCKKVNAPHVEQCKCAPIAAGTMTYTTTITSGSALLCEHANEVPILKCAFCAPHLWPVRLRLHVASIHDIVPQSVHITIKSSRHKINSHRKQRNVEASGA